MRSLPYATTVRAAPLLAELGAAGVPVAAVRPPGVPGAPTVIDLDVAPDDTSQDAATDAVVAAHDVAAWDAKADAAKHSYDDAVAYLTTFGKQASGTATNVQRDNAIKAITTILKTQHQQLREQGAG